MAFKIYFAAILLMFANCLAASDFSSKIAILRDLAKARGLFVGSAAGVAHFRGDPMYNSTLGQQFNLVTPENGCKWGPTEPADGKFDFSDCDFILNTTRFFNQTFRGHNLCWGVYNPEWLQHYAGNKTALTSVLIRHVQTVASRYSGKAYAWDVVNEAVLDNPKPNVTLKTNIWYPTVPDYIDIAFKTAHMADPHAKLFYNDYNAEGMNSKSDAVYNMLKSMIERGIPVQGVGLQSHFTLGGSDFTDPKNPRMKSSPPYDDMVTNIKRLANLGLEVHITELDVSFAGGTGTEAQKLQQQADVYTKVLKACLSNKMCKNYEVWGYVDKYSWRQASNEPDLFDVHYKPKPCFEAVADVLQK